MVIWLIGKSGVGKSEIGKRLYGEIKSKISNIIYLDGDDLRDAISWDLGHSKKDRYISEKRRSHLCKLLSDQNISIICSALSNSPELRKWNKQNIKDYYEIYIKTHKYILYERDSKGLYNKFMNKEIKNIVGEDIKFNEPENPWIQIVNNGDEDISSIVNKIILKINKEKKI